MKRIKSAILLLLILTIFTSCNKELEETPIGNLSGIVTDKFDNPLEDATISLSDDTLTTNAEGAFFGFFPVGEYSVTVTREEFLSQSTDLLISEGVNPRLEFILEPKENQIHLPYNQLSISDDSGNFDINVTSNADWTIVNNTDWISGPESGGGTMTVRFTYTKNESTEPRSDTLCFVSESAQVQLVVIQEGYLKILHVEEFTGNIDDGTEDFVHVLFNKPISVISISSNWDWWSANTYTLTDNNHGVRFNLGSANLGWEHPLNITVKDNFEKTHSFDFDVSFFDSRLMLEGFISDFILVNDDKEVLIAAYNPSRLIKYSLFQDSILQTYDLSQHISPLKLSYSPNNSMVYIMGSEPNESSSNAKINRPDIYRFDWQTGEIVKATTIETDHFGYPYNMTTIPYDLEFTISGQGIVLLSRNNNTLSKNYILIDNTQNYQLSLYEIFDDELNHLDRFLGVHRNFDNTKLFLRPRSFAKYGIFDSSTGIIKIIRPDHTSASQFITPCRKEDKFYAGQLVQQFIIDTQGNISQKSNIDNQFDPSADFSYRENEENFIYHINDGNFRIINHNNGTQIMRNRTRVAQKNLTSTQDGNYIVTSARNTDESSSIIIYKTERFYNHINK